MDHPDREAILEQLQDSLEKPMLGLSFVWLALLVVEFVWRLNRALAMRRYTHRSRKTR
jgi:voltage-gated potassium channel